MTVPETGWLSRILGIGVWDASGNFVRRVDEVEFVSGAIVYNAATNRIEIDFSGGFVTNPLTTALDAGGNNITNVGTVDGVDVSSHAPRHTTGSADELDGDQLNVDWNPSNYVPSTTPTEASSVDDLAAHLYGIDQAIGAVGTPDHGTLPGILDDDHPQYILANGTRAMTGDLDIGGNNLEDFAYLESSDIAMTGGAAIADILTVAAPLGTGTANTTATLGVRVLIWDRTSLTTVGSADFVVDAHTNGSTTLTLSTISEDVSRLPASTDAELTTSGDDLVVRAQPNANNCYAHVWVWRQKPYVVSA